MTTTGSSDPPRRASRSSGQTMVRSLIQQTGAEWDGHFVVGDHHSRSWIAERLLLAKAQSVRNLCRYLAGQVLMRIDGVPTAVVGLAPDGIALAHALGASIEAEYMRSSATEHLADAFVTAYADERFGFPPEYVQLLRGKQVVIVQSVIFTGRMAGRLIQAVEDLHPTTRVIGIAAIITRGQLTPYDAISRRLVALYDYSPEDCLAADCLQCQEGVPLTDPKALYGTG